MLMDYEVADAGHVPRVTGLYLYSKISKSVTLRQIIYPTACLSRRGFPCDRVFTGGEVVTDYRGY